MQNIIKRARNFFLDYKSALSIILIYSIIFIIIAIFFYPLIPFVLNYPEGTVGGTFQKELENTVYSTQYILIAFFIIFSMSSFIMYKMRGIENWRKLIDKDDPKSIKELEKIGMRCMSLPYTIYMVQIIFPSILLLAIHAYTTKSISVTTFKIWTAFISFISLPALISHIFSEGILAKIITKISYPITLSGKRIGLKKKIFIQMIPMFIVALLFTTLIGYSRLMKEKGDLEYEIYSQRLDSVLDGAGQINNKDDLQSLLKGINLEAIGDERFLISPQGSISSIDDETMVLSPYFKKYMYEMSINNHGRVYDYYGFDIQGVTRRINIGNEEWIVGIRYNITANTTVMFFMMSFVVMLFLCCLVLYYFSSSLQGDITVVANGLKEIAEGGVIDFDKKLKVTSNDEIGDLVVAFNKIQEKEKENVRSIQEKQQMLMDQERLASLGQLIGGIAHNLKTPIMSISGGVEALMDLVTEYDESIEDSNVTDSDHHEIAIEMKEWLQKIKPHCSYMSDIITTVKGQTVQLSNSTTNYFTVGELIKRVDILMKHELKKYNCKISLDSHVDMNTEISGEINNLVQIFDNIILNAIQSYGNESGIIDFKIIGDENAIVFSLRDYGSGIPDEVQSRLFNEMVTTKGKNGTGLGLYMSYSTIRGRFGGNMWFETLPGNGTTFHISIPCNSKYGRYQEVME